MIPGSCSSACSELNKAAIPVSEHSSRLARSTQVGANITYTLERSVSWSAVASTRSEPHAYRSPWSLESEVKLVMSITEIYLRSVLGGADGGGRGGWKVGGVEMRSARVLAFLYTSIFDRRGCLLRPLNRAGSMPLLRNLRGLFT